MVINSEVQSAIRKIEAARFCAAGLRLRLCVASTHPAPDGKTVVLRLFFRPQQGDITTGIYNTLYFTTITTPFDPSSQIEKQLRNLLATANDLVEATVGQPKPARRWVKGLFDLFLSEKKAIS
jgi:hypothetical protein